MISARWSGLGLAVGAVGLVLSGLGAQPSGTPDVGSYPPEVQKQYKVFAQKCSRCHDLSRPLNAKYSTEAQWRDMVARMARKPGAGISPKDQAAVTSFLVYRQRAQSGGTPPPAPEATPTAATAPSSPPSASPPVPVEGGVVNLAPPAARSEASAPRAGGTTESGGLRIEVDGLPAQLILVPADGRWTTESPGSGENLFLSVRLFDAATGEKVPYASVRARVGGESAPPAKPLRPLFSANGFQYGANFAAPVGDLEVSLEVEPPLLGRVNDDGHRWTSPLNLKLTLHGR
jgi:hypothetical protein